MILNQPGKWLMTRDRVVRVLFVTLVTKVTSSKESKCLKVTFHW